MNLTENIKKRGGELKRKKICDTFAAVGFCQFFTLTACTEWNMPTSVLFKMLRSVKIDRFQLQLRIN